HLFHHITLVLRRHANYTLFPYTTLFRSQDWGCMVIRNNFRAQSKTDMNRGFLGKISWYKSNNLPMPSFGCRQFIKFHKNNYNDEDRKSTRLNSSHLVSSYAVFCLKKKTH